MNPLACTRAQLHRPGLPGRLHRWRLCHLPWNRRRGYSFPEILDLVHRGEWRPGSGRRRRLRLCRDAVQSVFFFFLPMQDWQPYNPIDSVIGAYADVKVRVRMVCCVRCRSCGPLAAGWGRAAAWDRAPHSRSPDRLQVCTDCADNNHCAPGFCKANDNGRCAKCATTAYSDPKNPGERRPGGYLARAHPRRRACLLKSATGSQRPASLGLTAASHPAGSPSPTQSGFPPSLACRPVLGMPLRQSLRTWVPRRRKVLDMRPWLCLNSAG